MTTLSVTVGAGGVPVGDTIVLGVAAQGATIVTAASDSAGNTYHVDVIRSYAGTGTCTSALISAPVTQALSQGQTITVRLKKGGAWGFVAEDWRGLSGVFDRTGSADSASVAGKLVSVSTTGVTSSSNEAVLAVACIAGQPSVSVGNGYSLGAALNITNGTVKRKLVESYDTVAVTGAQTATFTLTKSSNWSAVIATYG
jgi:hypothetical protein